MQKMNKRELFQHYCNQIIAQNKEVLEDQDAIDFIYNFDKKLQYHQELFTQASLVLMATHEDLTVKQKLDRVDTCLIILNEMDYSGVQLLLLAVMKDFKEELEKKYTFLQQAQGLIKQ